MYRKLATPDIARFVTTEINAQHGQARANMAAMFREVFDAFDQWRADIRTGGIAKVAYEPRTADWHDNQCALWGELRAAYLFRNREMSEQDVPLLGMVLVPPREYVVTPPLDFTDTEIDAALDAAFAH